MYPMISVIVPVYNIAAYIEKCLESLVNQTYTNIQIILVDDGSSDGSEKICDEYKNRDNRIFVIHKENGGQAAARNDALNCVKGDYISFVDGDDWLELTYFETLIEIAIMYKADVVNCIFKRTKSRSIESKGSYSKVKIYNSETAIEDLCYFKNLNCALYTKLYKSSIWEQIKFPEGFIYEDMATVYKSFDAASKIVFIDYEGYYYYQRIGSSLHKEFSEKCFSRVYFSEEILSFIQINYPSVYGAGCCRLLWSCVGAIKDMPWGYRDNQIKKQIKQDIALTRNSIILDRKCRLLVRGIALYTYLPYPIVKLGLKIGNKIQEM